MKIFVKSKAPAKGHSVNARKFILELWGECVKDDVFGQAAQLAYYFLFALFPMLIFLASLIAYLPIPYTLNNLINYFSEILPPVVTALIDKTLQEITEKRIGLLSFGFLLSIWAASSGIHALSTSLNIAYGVRKCRPWWKERLLAITMTLVFTFLIITALSLLFFGGSLATFLTNRYQLGSGFELGWKLIQWPLIVLFVFISADLIYHFMPNQKLRRNWLTAGSFFALGSWLLISFAFKYYVDRFSNYTLTYGSLGSVIVLMLWLYLTSTVILIGGQINAILEQRTEEAEQKK